MKIKELIKILNTSTDKNRDVYIETSRQFISDIDKETCICEKRNDDFTTAIGYSFDDLGDFSLHEGV